MYCHRWTVAGSDTHGGEVFVFQMINKRAAEIPSDHFSLVQFQNISSRVCLLHCLFSNSLKKNQENNFVQRLKISEKVANVQKQTL